MDLFEYQSKKEIEKNRPLADRMRPRCLDEFVGQSHLLKEGTPVKNAIENDRIFSMILWGPPGSGKTTLARIVANETKSHFVHFSAVLSGVKEIRSVIDEARKQLQMKRRRTVLFVDEIHRFNKAQQDAFLHHVESGLLTLIGATTENPSFEVIGPLLSRCRVITLNPLLPEETETIIQRALTDRERGLGNLDLRLEKEAGKHLAKMADGDARFALNSLEIAASIAETGKKAPEGEPGLITISLVEDAMLQKALIYDKDGEEHYNLISAFHKSLRGSDPDAAIYWLGRMLSGGEDPLYIGRRMVRFASEDVGIADSKALQIALNAVETFRFLGPPEGELALAHAAVYLACAPKSNRIYEAFNKVKETIKKTGALKVPLHIRNAPTALMKNLDYGKEYRYPHDFEGAWVAEDYLPDRLKQTRFYFPSDRGDENVVKKRLEFLEKKKKEAMKKE